MPPSSAGRVVSLLEVSGILQVFSVLVAVFCSACSWLSLPTGLSVLADLRIDRVDSLLGLVDLLVERLQHQVLLALQLICPELEEGAGHSICSKHGLTTDGALTVIVSSVSVTDSGNIRR